jgi:hypothetical protein
LTTPGSRRRLELDGAGQWVYRQLARAQQTPTPPAVRALQDRADPRQQLDVQEGVAEVICRAKGAGWPANRLSAIA